MIIIYNLRGLYRTLQMASRRVYIVRIRRYKRDAELLKMKNQRPLPPRASLWDYETKFLFRIQMKSLLNVAPVLHAVYDYLHNIDF